MEKRPFFWAAMAGLGKYHMGGYGRIGVYRVNYLNIKDNLVMVYHCKYNNFACLWYFKRSSHRRVLFNMQSKFSLNTGLED